MRVRVDTGVLQVSLSLSAFLFIAQPVMALLHSPDKAIELAMKYEAEGKYPSAYRQYLTVAGSYISPNPNFELTHEQARLLFRRVLAMQNCCMKSNQGHLQPFDFIPTYNTLSKLEPENPVWPYMRAMVSWKAMNEPGDFFTQMHKAMACKGGPPAVRQQIAADYDRYRPEVNRAIGQDNAVVKKMDWDWDHGGKARYIAGLQSNFTHSPIPPNRPSSSSSSSSSNWNGSDYGGSQNAERNGDWGAADRLRNGNSTWDDRNSYSH